jgi:anti-sigma B factor antagonist
MSMQSDNWLRQDDFSAKVTRGEDGLVIVSLAGQFDLSTAEDLRESLVSPEVLGAPRVRVDLSEVTFLDSSGIGLLVSACKRVRSAGGTFSASSGGGPARRILEVAGLIEYLHVEEVV